MVHLSGIPVSQPPVKAGTSDQKDGEGGSSTAQRDGIWSQFVELSDEFTTSVYGSRFAAQTLPRDEMPEEEMPREIAYRMIKDDLSLDGNPRLK